MAIPNKTNLETLDYTYNGQPFCNVPAKDIDLTTLDYAFNAQPFCGNPFSGSAPVANVRKKYIGGEWKTVASHQKYIGGEWKTVVLHKKYIGGVWKTVF